MVKIRHGIFETNSSSSHSFVFRKYLPKDDEKYNENIEDVKKSINKKTHTISVDGEDCGFGWGFEILCTPRRKLEYCLVAYHDDEDDTDGDKEVLNELRKVIGIEDIGIKWEKNEYDDEYDYGYIDHQSHGLLKDFLKKYNISLADFIFDSRYVIFVDSDAKCDIHLLEDHDNGSLIFNYENEYYDDEYNNERWKIARKDSKKKQKRNERSAVCFYD